MPSPSFGFICLQPCPTCSEGPSSCDYTDGGKNAEMLCEYTCSIEYNDSASEGLIGRGCAGDCMNQVTIRTVGFGCDDVHVPGRLWEPADRLCSRCGLRVFGVMKTIVGHEFRFR